MTRKEDSPRDVLDLEELLCNIEGTSAMLVRFFQAMESEERGGCSPALDQAAARGLAIAAHSIYRQAAAAKEHEWKAGDQ